MPATRGRPGGPASIPLSRMPPRSPVEAHSQLLHPAVLQGGRVEVQAARPSRAYGKGQLTLQLHPARAHGCHPAAVWGAGTVPG